MRRVIVYVLVIGLLLSVVSVYAQNEISKKIIGNEFLQKGEGKSKVEIIDLVPKTAGTELPDLNISFGTSSFNTAVANELLIQKARLRYLRNWYTRQINEKIKPAIDKKIPNKKFKNFEEAKNELLIAAERKNISIKKIPVVAKYSSLRADGFSKQKIHKKALKVLKFRESEIKAGNLSNSIYADFKIGNTYLKDVKDLNGIKNLWDPLVKEFSKNTAVTHINNHIYKSIGVGVESEVIKLRNNHFNSLNIWDKLSYLQFLIHYDEYKKYNSPPYLTPPHINAAFKKFSNMDKATSHLIEQAAIKNKSGDRSIFDDWWIGSYANGYASTGIMGFEEALERARFFIHNKRNEIINKLLNETSIGANSSVDFLIENFGITDKFQKIWLNDNPSKATELVGILGPNGKQNKTVFGTQVLPKLLSGAEVAKLLEEFGVESTMQRKVLYDDPKDLSTWNKLANDNRVNGKVNTNTKLYVKGLLEAERILKSNFSIKFVGKYPNELSACCPGNCCPDPLIYENDKIVNQWGVEPMQSVVDSSFNLIAFGIGVIRGEEAMGKVVRKFMTELGYDIPSDVPDEYLGSIYRISKRNNVLVVEYKPGLLKVMLEFGLNTLDVISFLSPSKGGGAFLATKAGGPILITNITKYIKKISFDSATLDKVIDKFKKNATFDLDGTGANKSVLGHHPLSKIAFKGDKFYDAKKAFSVSNARLNKIKAALHNKITGQQLSLYKKFAKEGKTLTLDKMAEIEIKAMVNAGVPEDIARGWVVMALKDLKDQGAKIISNIPWGGLNN